ncbi:MAG TPA: hypothetical protein VFC51_15030 [Chloroflexota bacterium]|nr:hypothetical protein [Chloroflexota bacterium]
MASNEFEQRTAAARPTVQRENIASEIARLCETESSVRAQLMDAIGAFEEASRRLQSQLSDLSRDVDELRASGQDRAAGASARATDDPYRGLIRRVREVVQTIVPAGAIVAVVSRGDDDLLDFDGREGWHFPRNADGVYAGYHPADSDEALAHLELLRAKGAGYLLFPSTAFWWLDHYVDFAAHLTSRHTRIWGDRRCMVFGLDGQPAEQAPPPRGPEQRGFLRLIERHRHRNAARSAYP